MKKWIAFLLAAVLMISMSACGKKDDSDVKPTIDESLPTPTPTAAVEVAEAVEVVEVVEEPEAEAAEEKEPQIIELTETYTVKIRQDDFPIYDGPGYEYPQVDTIGSAGVYTIVAECRHSDGTLWGRLKSGVGWVNVSLIEQEPSAPAASSTPTPAPAPQEGGCTRCGVKLTDLNTAFEGFGLCEDCYEASLGPEDRCDNCGMDCSFSGKEEGLCPTCYAAKYPPQCVYCGGPEGEGHNCDDYPNVFCPQCDWSMHTTGVGIDGIVCPACGTRII